MEYWCAGEGGQVKSRNGLSKHAFAFWDLASRERKRGKEGDFFAAPISYILSECGIEDERAFLVVIAELQAARLCAYSGKIHDVWVIRVIKPARVASPANRFWLIEQNGRRR